MSSSRKQAPVGGTGSIAGDPSDGWSAGVATAAITPNAPMWLAGYVSRKEPAYGAESDLHAKAVAIEDEQGTLVVVVSVELHVVPRDLRDAVAEKCRRRLGIDPSVLVVNATHTHSAPLVSEEQARIHGLDADSVEQISLYREWLERRLLALVCNALENLRPAELRYSRVRCGFAMQRRKATESGVTKVPHPDGPVDHDVPVLAIERDGSLSAVLFGYACHGSTVTDCRYSGDWPGYAMRYVEEKHPRATALFLQGCGGDQDPHPRFSVELAKQHGRAMATAVEGGLRVPGTSLSGPLRHSFEEVPVEFRDTPDRDEVDRRLDADDPYVRRHAELLRDRLDERGSLREEYPYPIQAVGFGGELTMVALGGEVLAEYSLQLKETLPDSLWVAGYSNDGFTYVPTADAIREGGYESDHVTKYRPYPDGLSTSVEETVLSNTRRLAREVGDRPEDELRNPPN